VNDPPPGWGQDALTAFFAQALQNQWATFVWLREPFGKLCEIDEMFLKALGNLNNTAEQLPALFFFRAHAACRAAIQLGMGGQIAEAQAVLRSCLEYALYAYFVFKNPTLREVWLKRMDDDDSKWKARDTFRVGLMLRQFEDDNPRVGAVVRTLYEDLIDMGAHPNVDGVISNMKMEERDGVVWMETAYLNVNPRQLEFILKTSARVGVCALHAFQGIYKTRFSIDEIARLEHGL
jgi:hypothetical protein